MIGLGITTYNRPEYFKQCIDAVIEHLEGRVDFVCVYNDGSMVPYDYSNLPDWITVEPAKENKGVAVAKNWCLKQMMDAGCDYLFLMEDDIIITSPEVLNMYIGASLDTGIHHFMFAHHGPGNIAGSKGRYHTAEFYNECIGAFTMYTRKCIEEVGYMDENFKNAIEHVEHTDRISRIGLHPPIGEWGYADVVLSHKWLAEIPGSIENSAIRSDENWHKKIIEGLEYWKAKDPSFPFQRWLDLEIAHVERTTTEQE